MMYWVITVWLLTIAYPSLGRVITVNNAGVDSGECCEDGICPCNSLSHALQSLMDNMIIRITSESVMLGRYIQMGSGKLNNITITGNDVIIRCNNTGAIFCALCSNITIERIIWDQTGPHLPGGLFFLNVINLLVKNCTFKHSKACAVRLDNAVGNITIEKSSFISNFEDIDYTNCAGLQISYGNAISKIILNESIFHSNGYSNPPSHDSLYSACVNLQRGEIHPINFDIVIHNTAFVNNTRGLLLVVCSQSDANIYMSRLNVRDNIEEGVSVKVFGYKNSHQYFTLAFSTFESNTNSFIFVAPSEEFETTIEVVNSTFKYNNVIRKEQSFYGGVLTIVSSTSKSEINISNCNFVDNVDGAIDIEITKPIQSTFNCTSQSIRFSNVLKLILMRILMSSVWFTFMLILLSIMAQGVFLKFH